MFRGYTNQGRALVITNNKKPTTHLYLCMAKKINSIIQILVAILFLIGCLCLILTPGGKKLQAKYLGTYVATDAVAVNVFTAEYEVWGKSASNHIHECRVYLNVSYVANGQTCPGQYMVKAFPFYDRKKAGIFAKNYIAAGTHVTIYTNPKKNTDSVLYIEDEEHLVLNYFTLFIITVTVIFILFKCAVTFSKKN
jgi:hypothetical protein